MYTWGATLHGSFWIEEAVALARAVGCQLGPLLQALRSYRGEPHRVEPIATIRGIEYVDDSKGTNVGATVAALDGLGAEGRRLVVILGGDGKGQDFAPLVGTVARHARAVVLVGRDAPAIRSVLAQGAPHVPLHSADTLPAAVEMASAAAVDRTRAQDRPGRPAVFTGASQVGFGGVF